jgi:hypothetical protein
METKARRSAKNETPLLPFTQHAKQDWQSRAESGISFCKRVRLFARAQSTKNGVSF